MVVDDSYRAPAHALVVLGQTVCLPYRIHFLADSDATRNLSARPALVRCMLSRSTDGHLRQAAVRTLLDHREPWIIPFVVYPVGEYVAEIIEDIRASLGRLDRSAYANFVRENRPTMRLLRDRAASYWDCYYRHTYPDRSDYPGMAVLNELERWAA